MKAGNTYSDSMFNPRKMRNTVALLASRLPALRRQYGFDTIVVTGKSGIALGFALSMVTGVHVVAVRKGESSHGDMIEGDGHEFTRYAFLDDGIASGSTVERVADELKSYAQSRAQAEPVRVLCLLYSNFGTENDSVVEGHWGPTWSLPYHSLQHADPKWSQLAT